MHVDTKLSKNEQRLEDKYAAEYYEQLRLDMEKDDERLAMQLQHELELEERKRTRSTESDLSKDEVRICLQNPTDGTQRKYLLQSF